MAVSLAGVPTKVPTIKHLFLKASILKVAFGGRACHPAARALPVSIIGAEDAETEETA